MPLCPHCQSEMVPDPNNSQKLLCYTCKKRYEASDVANYWAGQPGGAAAYGPVTQPQSPAAQNQAPYGGSSPNPYGHQPVQPTAQIPDPFASQQQPIPNMNPYGSPPTMDPYGNPAYVEPPKPGKGLAIAALIIGIVAVSFCWVIFLNVGSILLGIVGIILGVIATIKAKKGTGAGLGFAIAGIILSILAIISSIVVDVAVVDLASKGPATEEELANMSSEELEEYTNQLIGVSSNTNENSNTSSNSNELNENSNSGNSSANTGSSSEPSGGAHNPNAGFVGEWTNYTLEVNGYKVVLGNTTLRDFLSGTQSQLKDTSAGFNNGYSMAPGENQMANMETGSYNVVISVAVQNTGMAPVDVMDCPIVSYSIDVYDIDRGTVYPSVVLPGGLTLGKSTIENMNSVYGTEYVDTSTFIVGGTETKNFTYEEPGMYGNQIHLTFENNMLTGLYYAKH